MSETKKTKHRLVTKSDLDGLVCAVLLRHLEMISSIKFAHPRDIENGTMEITDNDILAGLPYKESAHIAFDNYPGTEKEAKKKKNLVCDPGALSNARVIYKHFGGKKKFPKISEEMMETVDKGYSAKFTKDDILHPSSWELLNYLVDQRTGLERFKKFKLSHHELIAKLVNYCKDHPILEILSLPDVEERIDSYFLCMDKSKAQILRNATVHYNLVVIDMRKEEIIYPGNRFVTYALFPECNVSLQITKDSDNKTVFAAGKSIIDRSCNAKIGTIMSKHGGGGHANAGTCSIDNGRANEVLDELINTLKYGLLKNLFLGYFN